MSFVTAVLKRPYTVVAALVLICIMGVGAVQRMSVDIFPEIDIPVVSVVWTYSGMSPQDMQNRILTLHERQLASLVDDISRLEATAYNGVGVLKVYLHQGADVTRAISQLSSSALVILKSMPRNITPPLVLRYGATDVPIIQLSMSSPTLPDTKLNDLGQNIIRPDLAVVRGASIPYPYGGMPRVMMVDLDPQALQARGLAPTDVSDALQKQNVILPSGDVKIGEKDYSLMMNNSPDVIANINHYPVKEVDGKMVFIGDVAHVHDGHQVQSNSVSVDGKPGALVMVRKTEGVSTLAVIDGVKEALTDIRKLLPANVTVKPIFDQSIFVKAALNSVVMGGLMAAGLTALMILLFLGNWRLTLIILVTIPLSIVTATILMYFGGETLNTMTLGGFALAVGILVDNGTVVIENIERHVGLKEPLLEAIVNGAGEVGVPTMLSTLCICIVFVPIFLLHGTAKYLFTPLSVSVCLALIASLALSFTLVPALFRYLMRSTVDAHAEHSSTAPGRPRRLNPFSIIHRGFEASFDGFREAYRGSVSYAVSRAKTTSLFFVLLMIFSLALFPDLGRDFFPQVDAGQMRLHVRAPPATRIEETQRYFADVERAIRQIVGADQIDVVLDNIGLPYSGINIALSDSATVGPMDGEILVSLKKKHTPTPDHIADLRRELPKRFPALQFFFQPADIVDQVLNFGQPAPIDVRVTGPDNAKSFALASKIASDIKSVPGIADSHVFQVPNAPALTVDVDRTLAQQAGVDQFSVANNVLVTTNSSTQTSPNFWVNPATGASYRLIAQMPSYRVASMQDLWTLPIMSAAGDDSGQMLMNVSRFGRGETPLATSQLNIRPVFDVNADVQGTDLATASAGIDKVIAADEPPASDAMKVTLSGQVETMRESYDGLFSGMALAVALVYLALVINFQSWIDPLIVLAAVPFALGGVMWMLFLSQTHMSIPALMGTLMCIGLTTANSILVVTFANQRVESGDHPRQAAVAAGYTRLRPVLMTAGAMIIGMIPMAFGVGEGGEQNAPLARAVIGGLLFATFATLIFVPAMYGLLRKPGPKSADAAVVAEPEYAGVL
ncbi:MAG TPA: efflux RND transporter permease subunit [Roseiarcus sp.]|nr:efflux RND transporter permease subunit [Roseiarcus sp.]